MADGEAKQATMFAFRALVRGPDHRSGAGPPQGRPAGLVDGFRDAAEQEATFLALRPQLIERLRHDALPAWALLHLERDRAVRRAALAAERLAERVEAVHLLEAQRERAGRGEGVDPGLAAIIDAERARDRAERRFARRIAKVQLSGS
jgi:hypothetical protein